jgi:H+-transporting ATPase
MIGKNVLAMRVPELQTLAVVTLVFSGQAVLYVSRERRHVWNSWPSRWLLASTVADLGIITLLAANGILMTAISAAVIAGVLAAAVAFTFLLDTVKLAMFKRFPVA